MSLSANVNEKAALIWAIADKLTGVYKPHEYGEVILPLTVIRRGNSSKRGQAFRTNGALSPILSVRSTALYR